MKKIMKILINAVGEREVMLPKDSVILSAQFIDDSFCIFAIVDVDEPNELRKFLIIGTGQPFQFNGLKFIATVIQEKEYESLTWHIFERS
ncbi:MAG: hypothetical protein WC998_01445 [Candidatus Paceibacterota bacterium]|jgi:hypothetical protein